MELTVVIVNYRVKYLLEQTLRSVEQAMQGMACTIIIQQACHETGSHVLKRHCRAMEKLQHMMALSCLNQRYLEAEGAVHDVMQHIGGHIAAERIRCNSVAHFLQGHCGHVAQDHLRETREPVGHEQATIRSQAPDYRLFKCSSVLTVICTIIAH